MHVRRRFASMSLLVAALGACGSGAENSAAEDPAAPPNEPPPASRVDLSALHWIEPSSPIDLAAHRLVLLRWWTVQCPFCADSLPDLAALHERFRARGLGLVGVYHPKMLHGPRGDAVVAYARRLGFGGAIAADEQWDVLDRLRERHGLHAATSISVLVDGDGVVRWVHPGPRLHRSDDPAFADADRAYRQLEELLASRLD
jgi:hypothetical protein